MSVRVAQCGALIFAATLLTACGTFNKLADLKLPGAMGSSMTPDEVRKVHGDSAKYLLDPSGAEAAKARAAAAASKAKAAPPAPARDASGKPQRQAALAPSRGKQGNDAGPAAMRYGDLFFISGQLPTDVRGNPTQDGRVEEQARLALENVRAILEANQLTMANVVSMTVYLKSLDDVAAFDRIYAGYFKDAPPARSVVEVSRLPQDAKIEISAVAGR